MNFYIKPAFYLSRTKGVNYFMNNRKFYEGQTVKITGNTYFHMHPIGSIVVLQSAELKDSGVWVLKSEDGWYFSQDDCKSVEETTNAEF